MPDLVKIGRSIHGGRQRAKEINQTGVPTPFTLEMEMLTDEVCAIEGNIHESLSYCRESENREFFRIGIEEAIAAVINEISGVHVMREMESIVDEDTIAEFSWRVSKQGVSAHPFQIAAALIYLSPESIILALKKYEDAGRKRLERMERNRFGGKND